MTQNSPGNVVKVKLYSHVAIGVTKKGTNATKISSIANTDPNSFGGRRSERLDLYTMD